MNKKADEKRVKLVMDYITNNYKFEDTLKKYQLLDEAVPSKNNSILIPCPFHVDNTPSMSIDLGRNIYKCFSCQSSGNIISFESNYSTVVLGKKSNYFKMMDSLLKSDPVMQVQLGFSSIMVDSFIDTTGLQNMNLKKSLNFKIKSYKPVSFLELSKKMKSMKASTDEIIAAISLMESGLSPENIYDTLYLNRSNIKQVSKKEFEDLL